MVSVRVSGQWPPPECPDSGLRPSVRTVASVRVSGQWPPSECPDSGLRPSVRTVASVRVSGQWPPPECQDSGLRPSVRTEASVRNRRLDERRRLDLPGPARSIGPGPGHGFHIPPRKTTLVSQLMMLLQYHSSMELQFLGYSVALIIINTPYNETQKIHVLMKQLLHLKNCKSSPIKPYCPLPGAMQP